MTAPIYALWGVAFSAVLVSVARDVRDRIIPNILVAVVCAAGVAMHVVGGGGNIWQVVAVTTAVYIAGASLAYWQVIGGGDAKLIIASSLLVPPSQVVALLLNIAVAGGVLSCFYLAARAVLTRSPFAKAQSDAGTTGRTPVSNFLRIEAKRILAGEPMPYAIAIFGGLAFHFVVEVV